MNLTDIILLACNNLRRNLMRTILTILGVAVGIGALSSMFSFGKGISENVSSSLETNDIFTGLTVSARDIDINGIGSRGSAMEVMGRKVVPLNDSTIDAIAEWPEVALVFPEVVKPASVRFMGASERVNLKAVPVEMGGFAPFNAIKRGRFFDDNEEQSVVISKSLLAQMNIRIKDDNTNFAVGDNMDEIPLDELLGSDIEIVTKVFDTDKILESLTGHRSSGMPVKDQTTKLKIVGVVENNSFTAGMFAGGLFLPAETIHDIPSIDFQDLFDIMDGTSGKFGKYNTAHIRVREHKHLKAVKIRLEQMGFQVFSVGDKLDDIERLFMILDSILAAIGTVALLVAVLGIVNTLIMAIYERRKEIGIMKSLGATQHQIRMIFYLEAAIIGFLGGVIGVLCGTVASQTASSVANSHIGRIIDCNIDFFDYSWLMMLGAVLLSVLVSILASIYPANRAAKIDPLDALRRE